MNEAAASSSQPRLPIRIGRIDYVNVAPIYCGLDYDGCPDWLQIIAASPAALNAGMAAGELDAGPVSSGALVEYGDQWQILPDLSIACDGAVNSVILVSHVPFNDLNQRQVLLTDESGTAVLLLRLLFAINGLNPRFFRAPIDAQTGNDTSTAAALIIGDKALSHDWSRRFKYVWDLGELWWDTTGLPFVFAVWVVRKQFARRYPQWTRRIWHCFIDSRRSGYQNFDPIIRQAARQLGMDQETSRRYFKHLHFDLDEAKQKSLNTFFEMLHRYKVVGRRVRPVFWDDSQGQG